MLIFGHPLIEAKEFYFVKDEKDILKTPSNSIVVFEFGEDSFHLAKYCSQNLLSFALKVKDIKELLISNAWGAKFALVEGDFGKEAQEIAEEYLFDMKIILEIESEKEMIKAAKSGIDGVIFRNRIKFI